MKGNLWNARNIHSIDNMKFTVSHNMGEKLGLTEEKYAPKRVKDVERQQQNQECDERSLKGEHDLKLQDIESNQRQCERDLIEKDESTRIQNS